jgi:alkanesulfonate monooxygenase SsuD/methylene tetrahydromethanopterin reductase-like flavin-dependent oxidoreductase (luciferase family)
MGTGHREPRGTGRIGIRYDLRASGPPPGGAELARRYAAILAHAEAAERCGVDVLWVAERPFVRGALLPAAFPLCAALAERTTRARIATGAVPLPLHHPLRVAEDAATLDVLSGGRFELGVGLGEHAEGFDGFGVPIHERAGRFEEALDLVRRAWAGEAVGGTGGHFEIAPVTVYPRPTQRPHPPLWIAAAAEAAVRRAARLGTGLLTDSLDAARRFVAAWAEAGREPAAARVAWHLDPGGASAEASARRAAEGRAALAPARVDLVVPAPLGEADLDAAAERLPAWEAALRSSFAA